MAEDIATVCLEAKKDSVDNSQVTELFSSARLIVQAVVRVVSKENSPQFEDKIANLEKLLCILTEELKKRMS